MMPRRIPNLPEYVGEHSSSPKARICSNNVIIVFTFYINKNTNYILYLSRGTRHETCFIADSTNEIPQTQPLIGGEVIRQICGQSKGRGGRESRFSPLLGIFGQFGVPGQRDVGENPSRRLKTASLKNRRELLYPKKRSKARSGSFFVPLPALFFA